MVLDGDAASWTPGALSQSCNLGTAPDDITISITGDAGSLRPDYNAPNAQTPALSTTLHGGLNPPQRTLLLATDVTDVSFNIFDLDTGGPSGSAPLDSWRWPRRQHRHGGGVRGRPFGDHYRQFVVNAAGLSPDSGAGSNAGNLAITFSQPIRSLSFVFGTPPGRR